MALIDRIFSRQSENPARLQRSKDPGVPQRKRPQPDPQTANPRSPRKRLLIGVPVGLVLLAGAVAAGLSTVRSPESVSYNNSIWLDKSWTHEEVDEERLGDFAYRLRDNQIGTVYAYASTLDINGLWTGGPQGEGGFMESRDGIAAFVRALRQRHADVKIFAWIEIWTHLDAVDGYRLDDLFLHDNVADFSRQLINDLEFDGIMLDVKPLFNESDDFIRLIRSVRSAIGLDVPIAVAAQADLTPMNTDLLGLRSIAPGTMWSANFKKRVMVSADEVVILMYQSYRRDTLDYINWIAHQIASYVSLLETSTRVLASVPNYTGASDAHDPVIENISSALDGVNLGLSRLQEDLRDSLAGVAIFTDEELDQSLWNVYREKWLQR